MDERVSETPPVNGSTKTSLRSSREEPKPTTKILSLGMFACVGIFMFFCVIYIVIKTFTPSPTGLLSKSCPCKGNLSRCICARETVKALTRAELACLAISRVSAYALYPLYIILFLSMARNLRAWLQHTIVSEYVPLTSFHHVHTWAGTCVGVVIPIHALFHIVRWGLQSNIADFLFGHQTGITGFLAILLTPIIVWPMRLAWLRSKLSFEIRKTLHYTSWIWGAALCFHAPQQHVFWIIGFTMVVYWFDYVFGVFCATRMAPSARFIRLESSVLIRVRKPPGFELKGHGGYCYLCVPWVAKYEWHAFSAFRDPFDEDFVCFCIAISGDWTEKLHHAVTEPIYRRLWLYGPFPSPFETASDNDHVISIASGIGITPALSVVQSLADTRKMHLIWICRDANLLEFILDYGARFDDEAFTLIFYTGKRELVSRRKLPPRVFLLRGRPNLEQLIPSLIRSAQTLGDGTAPNVHSTYEDVDLHNDVDEEDAWSLEHVFYAEIRRFLLTYSVEEVFGAAVRRSRVSSRRVTFEGLRDLIESNFTRQFSDEQLRELFGRVDADKSGSINFKEFQDFIHEMEEETKRHEQSFQTTMERSHKSVKNLGINTGNTRGGKDQEEVDTRPIRDPEHWRLMYCGGPHVLSILKGISAEHHLPLSIESFSW